MHKFKKSFQILLISTFALSLFGCGTATNQTSSLALDQQANDLVKQNKGYQEKIAVLKEMKKAGTQDGKAGTALQQSLRDEVNVKLGLKGYDEAYTIANAVFVAYPSLENGKTLVPAAKIKAQNDLDKKDYHGALRASNEILQILWDEDAMSIKLAAEVELLNISVAQNDLKQSKIYYSDIMNVTSLKGNENLAAKYRASAEKYADKFPKDDKNATQPTTKVEVQK